MIANNKAIICSVLVLVLLLVQQQGVQGYRGQQHQHQEWRRWQPEQPQQYGRDWSPQQLQQWGSLQDQNGGTGGGNNNRDDPDCECKFSSKARLSCVVENRGVQMAYLKCCERKRMEPPFWLRLKDQSQKNGGCFSDQEVDDWEMPGAKKCWSHCVWSELGLMGGHGYINKDRFKHFISRTMSRWDEVSRVKMAALDRCLEEKAVHKHGANGDKCQAAWEAHLCWWTHVNMEPTLSCMENWCRRPHF